MNKLLIICSIIILSFLNANGQTAQELIAQINRSKHDTSLIRLQLKLGSYYLFKPGEFKNDLDSARNFLNQALQLSTRLRAKKTECEALGLIGNCYLEAGDTAKARAYFSQVTGHYHKTGNKAAEAAAYDQFGDWVSDSSKILISLKIQYYEQARRLFFEMNDMDKALELLVSENFLYTRLEKYDIAEKHLFDVLAQFKLKGFKKLYPVYDLLAAVYRLTGDPQKELQYRLNSVRNIESEGNNSEKSLYFYNLALLYNDLKMYGDSYYWSAKAIDVEKQNKDRTTLYMEVLLAVIDLVDLHKADQALEFLRRIVSEKPPQTELQFAGVNESFGNCYSELKLFDKADHYYSEMMRHFYNFYRKDGQNNAVYSTYLVHFNRVMATYFILTHQYVKAAANLKEVLALPNGSIRALTLIKIFELQFQVDSAQGNYISAIRYFKLHKKMNDSLFNVAKQKQIEDMQIRYETNKKEQAIKNLQSQAQSQLLMLQKANLQKKITIAGIAMLFIIAGFTYYGYRQKQKSNLLLLEKQKEINGQNAALKHLVSEKDTLLIEKDWLLKEVHHRVKNNLQIVMSLLSTQSAYLKNDEALAAIRESQNRVQAISLIHQRLYKASNVASIDMPVYINELINYLRDCFDTTGRKIRFEQLIEPIHMDLSQAIPAGLILNEAITNAIKYAFVLRGGQIIIDLRLLDPDMALLTIADNGAGLPGDFEIKNTSSLGMEMMKALAKQLNGSFEIKNNAGVAITVEFKVEKILNGMQTENLYV